MAGAVEMSTPRVEIHRTPGVGASAAVRFVFVFTQAQQHSRIVSCWVVEVEAGPGQQLLCAFYLPWRIRDERILRGYVPGRSRCGQKYPRGNQQIGAENASSGV